MPNHGAPAQNSGVRVNDDAVFDRRMPLVAANQLAIGVRWKAECAQGNSLIQLYVLANFARFADHDAGAVINEEVFTDGCSRIDVDPGLLVSPFGHHARNKRHTQSQQFMRNSVNSRRFEPWITENDLIGRVASGIAIKSRLHIG